MAKKTAPPANAFRQLKRWLKEGAVPGGAYLFYGEEQYLLHHYLQEVRRCILPPGGEAFNDHALEGRDLTPQALYECIETVPIGSDKTMVVVTDWDLYALPEEHRQELIALLEDVPEHCCLFFVYDALAYKPDKKYRRLCSAIDAYVTMVAFHPQDGDDLVNWIARRFHSLGKRIDRPTAEHLLHVCGELMTTLIQEIAKIAAYAKDETITRSDIDAVADPVLSAGVFKLTDAVTQGRQDHAAAILGDLLKLQEEPIAILGALGGQMRRLYTARLAIDHGRDYDWMMETWRMRDYPAELMVRSARRVPLVWCRQGVALCQEADLRMKSARGQDPRDTLKLLVARLGALRP